MSSLPFSSCARAVLCLVECFPFLLYWHYTQPKEYKYSSRQGEGITLLSRVDQLVQVEHVHKVLWILQVLQLKHVPSREYPWVLQLLSYGNQ